MASARTPARHHTQNRYRRVKHTTRNPNTSHTAPTRDGSIPVGGSGGTGGSPTSTVTVVPVSIYRLYCIFGRDRYEKTPTGNRGGFVGAFLWERTNPHHRRLFDSLIGRVLLCEVETGYADFIGLSVRILRPPPTEDFSRGICALARFRLLSRTRNRESGCRDRFGVLRPSKR